MLRTPESCPSDPSTTLPCLCYVFSREKHSWCVSEKIGCGEEGKVDSWLCDIASCIFVCGRKIQRQDQTLFCTEESIFQHVEFHFMYCTARLACQLSQIAHHPPHGEKLKAFIPDATLTQAALFHFSGALVLCLSDVRRGLFGFMQLQRCENVQQTIFSGRTSADTETKTRVRGGFSRKGLSKRGRASRRSTR